MRSPRYNEKFQSSVEQSSKVEKIKSIAPKGAEKYVRQRLRDLGKVKKFVSKEY